jgi:hypothetical protein
MILNLSNTSTLPSEAATADERLAAAYARNDAKAVSYWKLRIKRNEARSAK